MKIAYHPDYLKLTQTYGHPECPERLSGILSFIESNDIKSEIIVPEPATVEEVKRVHTPEYLEYLKNFGEGMLDPDCYVWPYTYDMAMLAAGGGLAAVKHTLSKSDPSFALLRPPGHHATSYQGMGFCYVNNIAVAAASLLKKTEKVAIVDIDVHHGNGTNDIFLASEKVLYISTHQSGIYPGTGPVGQTGEGIGEGYTVNIPVCSGSGDATFSLASKKIIIPLLKQFKPEILLVSLGVDAHYMDPLASLTLTSKGYMELIDALMKLASNICGNKISFFLEGGYNVQALAEVVGCTMAHASGQELETRYNEVSDVEAVGRDWVECALKTQKEFWKL
jgi:acetoin utilization deacetylase AcuC-like enzyme